LPQLPAVPAFLAALFAALFTPLLAPTFLSPETIVVEAASR
jgi:hypothetical protein